MTSSALAGAVIYTDSAHPIPTSTDVPVVYLDAPERVQAQLFGQLSADPAQAERDAWQCSRQPAQAGRTTAERCLQRCHPRLVTGAGEVSGYCV
jgi:integrating conjugative element protein (TIGR03757 family)